MALEMVGLSMARSAASCSGASVLVICPPGYYVSATGSRVARRGPAARSRRCVPLSLLSYTVEARRHRYASCEPGGGRSVALRGGRERAERTGAQLGVIDIIVVVIAGGAQAGRLRRVRRRGGRADRDGLGPDDWRLGGAGGAVAPCGLCKGRIAGMEHDDAAILGRYGRGGWRLPVTDPSLGLLRL